MQLGSITRFAGAGIALAALVLGALQLLSETGGEVGTVAGGGSPSAAGEGQLPSERLLPGEPSTPEPQDRIALAIANGSARPAPVAQAAASSSPPRAPGVAQTEGHRAFGQRQVVADEGELSLSRLLGRAREAVREVLVDGITEVEREEDSYEVEFESAGDDGEVAFDLAFLLLRAEADEDDRLPTAAQVRQAEAAARAMAALGDVIEIEHEDDGYEVEFSSPDGTVLEVGLDRNLDLVAIEVESD